MTSYCQFYCQRRGGVGKWGDVKSRENRKLLIAKSLPLGQKPFEGSNPSLSANLIVGKNNTLRRLVHCQDFRIASLLPALLPERVCFGLAKFGCESMCRKCATEGSCARGRARA